MKLRTIPMAMLSSGPYKLGLAFVLVLALIGIFTANTIDTEYNWNRLVKVSHGPIANGMPLRIMFIGASVTRGEQSTGDRGYRKYVRDNLTALGNPVNCVGFNRFGDFVDNDVEGYGAKRIRHLHEHAIQAVPALQPNLIIVQVGTSDCFQKDDTINILARMRDFMYYMLEASPQATIILSTLVTTPNLEFEPCMLSANAQIRQVAYDLMREKKPVALAEMHYDQGLDNRPKPEDIGNDRIHPTNEGYIMMGEIFLEKIREVEKKGFLKSPVKNGIPDNGEDGREVEDRIREETLAVQPPNPRSRRRLGNIQPHP
ncbi:carbohydrate esterase family 3 protein [Xylariaceae sp. FL1651]|nr:carbohydrate esterase family 3 protein [Xylariaceae sp. FL1651]